MNVITDHAQDRALHRFNFQNKEMKKISNMISSPLNCKLIKFLKDGREVKEITYLRETAQVITRGNVIITIIPPTYMQDEDAERVDKLRKSCAGLSAANKVLHKKIKKYDELLQCGAIKSVKLLFDMRKSIKTIDKK